MGCRLHPCIIIVLGLTEEGEGLREKEKGGLPPCPKHCPRPPHCPQPHPHPVIPGGHENGIQQGLAGDVTAQCPHGSADGGEGVGGSEELKPGLTPRDARGGEGEKEVGFSSASRGGA